MKDGFAQRMRQRTTVLVRVASMGYLALTLVGAALLNYAGDASWVMTLLTFGPRWVVLTPIVPLAVADLIFCRRALVFTALAAVCTVGPIMGCCVPWRTLINREPDHGFTLRVATFNVGGGTDAAGMIRFFREFRPDVVAFQEWPSQLGYPEQIERHWHWQRSGELFIASRYPISNPGVSDKGKARRSPAFCCDIETPAGTVHVHCLHLYTLRKGLEAVRTGKWKGAPELERVTAVRNEDSEIASRFTADCAGPSLVLGDFNTTADSTIFQRDWSNWQDAFSIAGWGLGHTFASRRIGLRIDHILADKHWYVRSCQVGPDLHGQHHPVVAELLLLDQD